jgi:hypothetical protein
MLRLAAPLLLLPGLAPAEEAPAPFTGYPPMEGVDYYCNDRDGIRHELGEVICVTAGCDSWTARCDMSLNSPTWRRIGDGCPGASLQLSPNLRTKPAQPQL